MTLILISCFSFPFRRISRRWNEVLSISGFLLIVVSVVFFNNSVIPLFPNVYTLIPTNGAALIILYGHKHTCIGSILCSRLLRWIGLISYSAYLWHQPILAFLRLYPNEISQNSISLIVIIVVFPLSCVSYYFVEQPFRDKKRFSRKKIFKFAAVATCITFIAALFFIRASINRSLMADQENDTYLFDLRQDKIWDSLSRDAFMLGSKKKTFSNDTSKYRGRIALIGDSFARDLYNIIREGRYLTDWDICVHFIYARCQIYMADEDRLQFIEAKFHQTCRNGYHIKHALPIIRKANIILLSSNWTSWAVERLPITLQRLNLTKEHQVYIFGPKHMGKINPMRYVKKSKSFRLNQYQYPDVGVLRVNELLEKTIDKSIFVNMQKLVCMGSNGTCRIFTPKGKLISYDGEHLTQFGALHVGKFLFQIDPLKKWI